MAEDTKQLTLFDALFLVAYVLTCLVLYFKPVDDALSSRFTYCATAFIFLFAVVLLIQRKRFNPRRILFLAAIIVSSFSAICISGLPIGDYFPLVWFITIFVVSSQLSFSGQFVRILLIINVALICYLFLYSAIHHYEYIEIINGIDSHIDLTNPNVAAVGLLETLWLTVYSLSSLGDKTQRIGITLLFIITLIGIILCGARTVLFSYIISVFLFLIVSLWPNHSKRITALVFAMLMVGSIVIIPVVANLPSLIGNDAAFLGKSVFTGRERIWMNYLNHYANDPMSIFTGVGKPQDLFWHQHINQHNSFLGVLSQYGIIALVLVMTLFSIVFIESVIKCQTIAVRDYALLALLIAVLLIGWTEILITAQEQTFIIATTLGLLASNRFLTTDQNEAQRNKL